MQIQIRDIHKAFGSFPALKGVNLDIESGELIALLGPSGSGKTTLLRTIAGLEYQDYGTISFGGEGEASRFASTARGEAERPATDGRAGGVREERSRHGRLPNGMIDASSLPVRERGVGFVFQHYALFKHMTVADNIAFGLSVRKGETRPSKEAIGKRVGELLELVQLAGLEKRYPAQLSGGQRQRVALARALAIDPKVLLLDEPFGALDAKVRKDLRRWLRELHDKTGYTTIFVTHDQEEALELADRVVVMNRGQIEQVGTTDAVYERPETPFVFDFLGSVNILPGEVEGRHLRFDGSSEVWDSDSIHPAGLVDIYVRPHDLQIAEPGGPGLDATVTTVQRTGALIRISAQLAQIPDTVELELSHLDPVARSRKPGDAIRVFPISYGLFPRAPHRRPATLPDVVPNAPAEYRERGR